MCYQLLVLELLKKKNIRQLPRLKYASSEIREVRQLHLFKLLLLLLHRVV